MQRALDRVVTGGAGIGERGGGERPIIRELPASPLALAPYMLGLPDQDGREQARFELYSDLIAATPLLELSASLADPPDVLAAELEASLPSPAPLIGAPR